MCGHCEGFDAVGGMHELQQAHILSHSHFFLFVVTKVSPHSALSCPHTQAFDVVHYHINLALSCALPTR